MSGVPPRALDGFGLLVRLGLAAVWIISGGRKVVDLGQNAVAVRAYELMPDSTAGVVATVQPFLEVALGALLLVGIGIRLVSVLSLLLFAIYIAGIISVWARGLSIDCGCFSAGGSVSNGASQYPWDIARDVGFAAMSIWLIARPRTMISLDGLLGTTPQPGGGPATATSE